jgi:hypothetical protein
MAAASFDLHSLLGADSLVLGSAPFPIASLEGKVVAFYFSAHWCRWPRRQHACEQRGSERSALIVNDVCVPSPPGGPCKAFTPLLIAAYHAAKASCGASFELIFVSSDQSEEAWEEYYQGMPWPAVKYEEEEVRQRVKDAFGCKGIPQLSALEPVLASPPTELKFTAITHLGMPMVKKEKERIIQEWCADQAVQAKMASAGIASSEPAAATPAAAAAAPAVAASGAFSTDEDF